MQRPPSPSLRFDPITLDEYLSNPQMRVPCPQGMGQIYLIKPRFSNSGSNGYVGKNETTLLDRFQGHKTPKSGCRGIANALTCHGFANFTIQRLEDGIVKADIPAAEKKWVAQLDTWKNGYNCSAGGETSTMMDEEVRRRHKIACKESHNTPEYKAKSSKINKEKADRPGWREARSKLSIEQHADPIKKATHSKGVSKGWIKRKVRGKDEKHAASCRAMWTEEYKAKRRATFMEKRKLRPEHTFRNHCRQSS